MSSDRYNHDVVKQENEKHMYRVTYWDDIYGNWTDLPAETPGWYSDMRYKCNGVESELITDDDEFDTLSAVKARADAYISTMGNPLDVQTGGSHYKDTAIQPIEYIHANNLGFIEGNIVKYITRHKAKNGIEDIKKIKHYCDLLIELEYGYEVHE